MIKPKDNRGGPDRGQGRKKKYPTESVTMRVPIELKEKILKLITNFLNKTKTTQDENN